MKTILALAAILVFALPVAAQNNCNIELKPLKPLTPLGCTDTTPICLCGGTRCHWTWACVPQGVPSMTAPATAPSWLPSGIDPTIPLQVSPVQMPDLMETYRKALEIRNLQLQQQNQQVPRPAAAPTSTWGPASSDPFPRTEPPSLRTPAERANLARQSPADDPAHGEGNLKTDGLYNGRAWLGMHATERVVFITGAREALAASPAIIPLYFPKNLNAGEFSSALDSFYGDAESVPIPIIYAMGLVTLRANGAPPSVFAEMLASTKRMLAQPREPKPDK